MLLSGDRNVELPPVDKDTETVARAIQPGTEVRQGSVEKLPVTDLCNPGKYAFVWGITYYDDGYGSRRFTRFCHRYSTASYNRGTNWNLISSVTRSIIDSDKARYHTKGNDAD